MQRSRRNTFERLAHRRGNLAWKLLAGLLALAGVIVILLTRGGPVRKDQPAQLRPKLMMYAAAGLRGPAEKIAAQYGEEYGVAVDIQFGGSNTLLNQLQVNKFNTADLFLAADDFYTSKAVAEGLAAEVLSVATQRPVIAVRNDSSLQIASIHDLLSPTIKISIADPEQAALGRAVKGALDAVTVGGGALWPQLEQHVRKNGVIKPTVMDVATDVKLGAVDAGIVWDSTVAASGFRDSLKAVTVPEFQNIDELVSVAVLKSSSQPTEALRFARFIAARDKGLVVFRQSGLQPVDGDTWTEAPELTFYCGAVNRRAVEQIVVEFQKREGVIVNTVFDGCGTLTSRMKTIDNQQTDQGFPDIYMACDRYYLDNVRDWFQDDIDVSDMEIVLAIPKGTDKVRSLTDLAKPGVRVAIGQPDQCTIGALTRRMLQHADLYETLRAKQSESGEVVVEKPSSALIVPDVVTGHVDVGVAYLTDVLAAGDQIDVIHVDSPQNLAIQPFSIARTSGQKHLARRFLEHLARSRQTFESLGFHFRLDAPAPASGG